MTSSGPWLQELREIPPSERRALLESLVVPEFKRELMMDDTDVLPYDRSYFELGLNSLGATDIRQRLEKGIGRPIDSAHLFNHPTVGHLVDFLVAVAASITTVTRFAQADSNRRHEIDTRN